MKSKTILVTAVYGNESVLKYGGRLDRLNQYISSLMYLAKTNAPIVCFCGFEDYDNLVNKFSKFKNIVFVRFDLKNIPLHPRIRKVMKDDAETYKGLFWEDKSPEIMYCKFYFLRKVINVLSPCNVYWVNAGLIHSDYIYDLEHGGYDRIFNNKFVTNLNTLGDGKIICFEHTSPSNSPVYQKNTKKPYKHNYDIFGRLFGGPTDKMIKLLNELDNKMKLVLNDGIVCSDESILSEAINEFEEIVKKLQFDSFHHITHDEWNDSDKRALSGLFTQSESNQVETVVTLLCIDTNGNGRYVNFTNNLIEQLLKHTNYDIIVSTNVPEKIKKSNRIITRNNIPKDIRIIIEGTFNYNLKCFCFENIPKFYTNVLFMDVDGTIEFWNEPFIKSLFEYDAFAEGIERIGAVEDIILAGKYPAMEKKLNFYGKNFIKKHKSAPLPSEWLFGLKNDDRLKSFYEYWQSLMLQLNNSDGVRVPAESLELGASLEYAGYVKNKDITWQFFKEYVGYAVNGAKPSPY